MLGFWSQKRDPGEVTPKASNHPERNPFEASLSASGSGASAGPNGLVGGSRSTPHSRKNSTASSHSIPAGLRTPTLQKSFVLPETTATNATGSSTGPSTSSAASSLHHSPAAAAAAAASHGHVVGASGRNTPIRAHSHQHQLSNPYPAPASPRLAALANSSSNNSASSHGSRPPDFKLSQPPEGTSASSNLSPKKQSTAPPAIAKSLVSASGVRNGNAPSNSSVAQTSASSSSSSSSRPSAANSSVAGAAASNNPALRAAPAGSSQQQQQGPSQHNTSGNGDGSSSGNGNGTGGRKRGDTSSNSVRGKLTVKIMEARNLAAPTAGSRPYVVATFEQNEFVSREAINEDEEDATGHPVSPQSSSALRKVRNGGPGSTGGEDAMDTSTHSAFNPVWKHEVAFDVTADNSPVTVCVYDRYEGQEEAFLGQMEVKPRLVHGWNIDDWFPLQPRADEQVSGDVRIRIRFEKSEARRSLRASDFEFLKMIGKGTFGRVFQVRKKDTKRIYAMKVLSKREIIAKKEVQHTIGERKILQRSSECPFLLGLKFSFQSETELFLVMDFKSGGELFHHLQREGRFTEDRARFYAAEITLAFEYLHKYNIVYRDLKPENILLDATGHIVLCDFGLSKPDLPSNALTNTFCGTTEYLAPEVLLDDHGYSQTVDFWSLGVLLFEMCCGWSPFYAEDTQQMYKNICFGKIKFPRGVIGDDGKQFVKGLLNRNPAHRLGAKRDAAELKEHPFFSMIDWEALAHRQVAVPFKPFVDSDESTSNFDPEFTEADVLKEAPVDSTGYFDDDLSGAWLDHPSGQYTPGAGGAGAGPVPIHPSKVRTGLDEASQDAFRGFSYSGDVDLHDLMMQANMNEEPDEQVFRQL